MACRVRNLIRRVLVCCDLLCYKPDTRAVSESPAVRPEPLRSGRSRVGRVTRWGSARSPMVVKGRERKPCTAGPLAFELAGLGLLLQFLKAAHTGLSEESGDGLVGFVLGRNS